MKRKKHTKIKIFILFLPIIISFVWLIYLELALTSIPLGTMLSPSEIEPLIISLIIFIIGYLLFLSLMFFEEIKKFLSKLKKH